MKPIDVLFTALGTCATGVSGMLALRLVIIVNR